MNNKLKSILGTFLIFGGSSYFGAKAEIIDLSSNMDCIQANVGGGTCGAGGTGTGVGKLTLDTVTNLLTWNVSYSGLSSTVSAAHFRGPALPNQIAAIQLDIGISNPTIGNAVLTPQQSADILAGQWYLNIETAAFDRGEIRGQVNVMPSCKIQMNQLTYLEGETVTAEVFRFSNPSRAPVATEFKIWLDQPGAPPVSGFNQGADGSLVLPENSEYDLGPVPIGTVTASTPLGNYEVSCRVLDPVTGQLLAEDRNFFEIPSGIYAIGQTGPAGGIVFYITDGGAHGLEAAPVDLALSADWGCSSASVPGAQGVEIGTGQDNTLAILASCGNPGIAARLAADYELNGFDDWFLPSKDELNALCQNKAVVGEFPANRYASSSEWDLATFYAWYQWFPNCSQTPDEKLFFGAGVRPIRAF